MEVYTTDLTMTYTEEQTPEIFSEEDDSLRSCQDMVHKINWYLYLVISITGCVANIVLFLLLRWKAHVSVTNFLLKWLALVDALYLICTSFKHGVCHQYCGTWNLLFYSIERTVQLCSLWSIVVLAIFRYIAICKPFQAHRYLTYKRAYLAVSLCLGGSALVNIPFYILALDVNDRVIYPWLFHQVYIGVVYFCILYFLLPCSVLVVVNTFMLRALHKLSKDSDMATNSTTEMKEVTKVVLVIVVVFILSYATFPLYWIDWYFYRRALAQIIDRTCTGTFFYSFLYEVLPLVNASVNLFIYALLRKSFRQNLKSSLQYCRHA